MKILRALVAVMVLGGLWACAAATRPQPADDIATPGDRELRRGIHWYHKGCMRKAMDHLRAAHEHYCLADQRAGTARSLNGLANVYRQSGNPAEALLFYDAAMDAARHSGDPTLIAQVLSNKAAALIDAADYVAAGTLLDEAQRLVRPSGPLFAMLLNHRAVLEMQTGRVDQAAILLDQAETAAGRRADDAAAAIRFSRGRLMKKTGRLQLAMAHFEKALELDRRAGFANGMAADLDAMAEVHEQREAYAAALDCLQRSIKIHALLEDRQRVLKQLDHLERLAEKNGGDIRVTVHFVNQWLAGEAIDAICR